jgi:hypothetical protein
MADIITIDTHTGQIGGFCCVIHVESDSYENNGTLTEKAVRRSRAHAHSVGYESSAATKCPLKSSLIFGARFFRK